MMQLTKIRNDFLLIFAPLELGQVDHALLFWSNWVLFDRIDVFII
jgi:hypothetical protein